MGGFDRDPEGEPESRSGPPSPGEGRSPNGSTRRWILPLLVAVLLAGSATLGATSHVNVDRLA
jgi:hypothetical protein